MLHIKEKVSTTVTVFNGFVKNLVKPCTRFFVFDLKFLANVGNCIKWFRQLVFIISLKLSCSSGILMYSTSNQMSYACLGNHSNSLSIMNLGHMLH